MSKSENGNRKSGNEKQNVDKIPQKSQSKPKNLTHTSKELMHEHLADKTHIITDDDLKNLDLTTPEEINPSNVPVVIEDSNTRPHDEDKDHRFTTPWDVLDE